MTESRYSKAYGKRSRSRSRSPRYGRGERDRKRRRESGYDNNLRNRLFVSNIPFKCNWMELKDLFREKVGDVTYVELLDDSKGMFNGTGVVEFKDEQTAQKAMEIMDNYELKGRPLHIKLDTEHRYKGRRYSSSPTLGINGSRRDLRSKSSFNTYGLNPDFLTSLDIEGPLITKVFISNLDYKVTEKKLLEIFKLAGKLVKMELITDDGGNSKGHAICEYEHPLEAVQAISMFNGQKLFSRFLKVHLDRFPNDEPASKLPIGLYGIGKGLGANGQPMVFNKTSNNELGTKSYSGSILNCDLGLFTYDKLIGSNVRSSSLTRSINITNMDVDYRNGFQYSQSAGHGFKRYNDATDSLIIKNLPSSFTWQMIKDRFGDIGNKYYADMKGPGIALLRFESSDDAERAHSMLDGTRIQGKTLDIRFY